MCVIVTKVGEGHPKCSDATPLLDLSSYQTTWSLYLTSRRRNGSRNIANVRGAPKIGGDVCTPISWKRSYEK